MDRPFPQIRKRVKFSPIIIIIIIIITIISFMQVNYIPETKYVPQGIQRCSYSVVTIHGAYIFRFSVESIVLLH